MSFSLGVATQLSQDCFFFESQEVRPYNVVMKTSRFEIRHYAPFILASTVFDDGPRLNLRPLSAAFVAIAKVHMPLRYSQVRSQTRGLLKWIRNATPFTMQSNSSVSFMRNNEIWVPVGNAYYWF